MAKPRRAQRARVKLRCHPDTPCSALSSVEVEIARGRQGQVAVSYFALGNPDGVIWPPPARAVRADRLWEHSCFELFVKSVNRDAYYEVNVSPSAQWAAYRFAGYRTGMEMARGFSDPEVATRNAPTAYVLSVTLDLVNVPGLAAAEDWPVALSAVIEEKNGAKSFWALAHPSGRPDFHHADCFALILAPPLDS